MRRFSGKSLMVSFAVFGGTLVIHDGSMAQDSIDPVLDRQLNMQELERNSNLMGLILAGIEPATKLSSTADALAKDARDIRESFQSKTVGGSTKVDAWTNWDDFSKRLDDMVTKTEHMAEVAKTGNVAAVTELVSDAVPCKSCHTAYRVPKTRS